jgi:hypothetical protein
MRLKKTWLGIAVPLLVAVLATTAGAGPGRSRLAGEGKGLKLIANIKYTGGTDMEFATIKGRDYAFAGAAESVGGTADGAGAFRVIDVTNPAKPKVAATLKCSFYQGDVQLSHDKKVALLAQDDFNVGGKNSCLAATSPGFMTIDIRNPKRPKPLGFAKIARGSHNITAHPTKPFVYNSDSDLENRGEIEIWSIANPRKPKLLNTVDSLPHSPHDVSFNKKGTLAVMASVSHFDIWETKNPAKPTLLYTAQCPGCSITHDAKFTPNGKRIVIGDEGGGGGEYPCPGGALYFYDLHDAGGRPVPVLTAVYEPQEFGVVNVGLPQACTSHVFDISDNGKFIAISWYSAGTRYLDISSSQGATLGGNGTPGGIVEKGWFIPEGSVSWSSKFHKGPHIYSNDEHRGFDVYKITAK